MVLLYSCTSNPKSIIVFHTFAQFHSQLTEEELINTTRKIVTSTPNLGSESQLEQNS